MKFVDQEGFHQRARNGRARDLGVVRQAGGVLRSDNGDTPVRRFVFSDGSVDRMGDTINPNGWDLAAFKQNPVILWAHDSSMPPVGRAPVVFSDGTRLLGDIEFAVTANEFSETVFRLVRDGYIRACSVGFLPLAWTFSEDPARPGGIDFTRAELLECSICPVPANGNALVEARRKGIDTRPLSRWAERTLDRGGLPLIEPRELIRLREMAREPENAASRQGRTETRRRRLREDGLLRVHLPPDHGAAFETAERERRADAMAAADAVARGLTSW